MTSPDTTAIAVAHPGRNAEAIVRAIERYDASDAEEASRTVRDPADSRIPGYQSLDISGKFYLWASAR
jgi:hypothetical protein